MVRVSAERRLDRLDAAVIVTGEHRFAEVLRTLSDLAFCGLFAPLYDGCRAPSIDVERTACTRFVAPGNERFRLMALGARSVHDTRPANVARMAHGIEPLKASHRQRTRDAD